MKTVYTHHRNWADIVQWLQDNVGPMLHHQAIIFWHGQGWHVRRFVGQTKDDPKGWSIEFTSDVDDNKILLFKIQFG